VEHIGKEANRWEEQHYLGLDVEAQTEYGTAPESLKRILETIARAGEKFGQRSLAKAAGVSLSEVSAVLLGKRTPKPAVLSKLYKAVSHMEREAREQAGYVRNVLDIVRARCQYVSVRQFARQADIDAANLAHVLNGQRKPSQTMLVTLRIALALGTDEAFTGDNYFFG
jgi:transcriptional regulator with XRE-family HTH domain